jgi:predicted ATPase
MFTRLRIENFKAWRDTGEIRLAPLTVFFGPNSSGKTSLLQFLLLLKQTMESPDRKQVLNLGGSHSYIDFGSWSEMLFGGDTSRGLRFEFGWRVSGTSGDEGSERERSYPLAGDLVSFSAEIGSISTAPIGVREFSYVLEEAPLLDTPVDFGLRHDAGTQSYELVVGGVASRAQRAPFVPRRFYGFPEEARLDLEEDFEFSLERQLDSTHYLGPIREAPERRYTWSGEAPANVGFFGENAVAALLAAQERVLESSDGQRIHFGELLASWLVRTGLLESFETPSIGSETSLYRVMVRTPGSRRQVNLTDVGFGVSQVLPVLVQLLYAEPHTTLMFEQPEIHLHPRIQSELADLFIETLEMRQDNRPRGIQCIVESHSEHFLRRLQRRIAEGKLAPDQTALYFCKPGPEGSTIEELQVDKYGRISNWPEDFFGNALGDTEQQMDAMLRRMEQEEPNASG